MNRSFLPWLECPETRQPLHIESGDAGPDILEGWLATPDGARRYPVRGGIPRFVPESGYADNFGMQWNKFARTQLDSHTGHPISADRFWAATGWTPGQLKDRWVLDVGCGAGRFAEIALNAGAKVVALDYSTAVEACYANLGPHPDLHVVQGDIYALPFRPSAFPFIYSLGVLQHTPDVGKAFAALPPLLEPGGELVVDYYFKTWKTFVTPKYWLRPVTKRLPQDRLFRALQRLTPPLLAVSRTVGKVPVAGKALRRLVPVANYEGDLPLDRKAIEEFALLDTFDWLAPAYDSPQTAATVRGWAERAGLEQVEVEKVGHLVCRGRAPSAAA